jgi:hypothetical protein
MEANIMTDFQFRAVIRMVLNDLKKVKTLEELEEAKEALEKLADGETGRGKDKPGE